MSDRTYSYLLSGFTSGVEAGVLVSEVGAALAREVLGVDVDSPASVPPRVRVVFTGSGDLTAQDAALLDGGQGAAANDPPTADSILGRHDGNAARVIARLVDLEAELLTLTAVRTRLVAAENDLAEVDRRLTEVNSQIADAMDDAPAA